MTAGQPDSAYASLFREYVQRGAQATLATVQTTGSALPAEQREQSLHTLDFALGLPDAWPEARALLLALAPKLELAGFRRDYLPYLQRGIEQCRAAGDAAGQAEMELHLGLLTLATGRLDEARGLFSASAGRFHALGDALNQARALNRWAYTDRLQQRTDSAVQRVHEAMALTEPQDPERVYSQFVLGCLAVDSYDWPAALDYFQQALAGWQRHGDAVMVARSLTNLGTAQRGAGQFEAASASFSEAIALMTELGDPVNAAVTRMNLGNLCWAQSQPQQAMEHYLQAEPVFRQSQDQLRLARINTNMGIVYMQLGRWDQAQAALASAIDLNRGLGDRRAAANALDGLGELRLRQGQPAAALASLHEALAELDGFEATPGYAALFADIHRHIAEAQQALGA